MIDDERDQVDLMVWLLQAAGHMALGSTDGSEAVALAESTAADAIVLDFMLSDMTGGDVCKALRSNPDTRAIKIVVVSGTMEAEIKASCTQYDAYLCKPAEPLALLKVLESPR